MSVVGAMMVKWVPWVRRVCSAVGQGQAAKQSTQIFRRRGNWVGPRKHPDCFAAVHVAPTLYRSGSKTEDGCGGCRVCSARYIMECCVHMETARFNGWFQCMITSQRMVSQVEQSARQLGAREL